MYFYQCCRKVMGPNYDFRKIFYVLWDSASTRHWEERVKCDNLFGVCDSFLKMQKLLGLLCHCSCNFLEHYGHHKADKAPDRGYSADVLTSLLQFPSFPLTVHLFWPNLPTFQLPNSARRTNGRGCCTPRPEELHWNRTTEQPWMWGHQLPILLNH